MKTKHVGPEVIACLEDELKPYDVKAASRALIARKRTGEADWNEKLPKKRSIDQLKKEYAGKTIQEIMDDNYPDMSWIAFEQAPKPKPLEVLLELCQDVVNKGGGFENLLTEWDRAKDTAQQIMVLVNEIKDVVETQISQEDARLAKQILKVLDVRYKPVLADQVRYIKFEGTDLYSWMHNQCYSNKHLNELIRRENIIQSIYKYSNR